MKIDFLKPLIISLVFITTSHFGNEIEKLKEAKRLYENKCGQCHPLFDKYEYEKEEWPFILSKMKVQTQMFSNEDISILEKYLQDQ